MGLLLIVCVLCFTVFICLALLMGFGNEIFGRNKRDMSSPYKCFYCEEDVNDLTLPKCGHCGSANHIVKKD